MNSPFFLRGNLVVWALEAAAAEANLVIISLLSANSLAPPFMAPRKSGPSDTAASYIHLIYSAAPGLARTVPHPTQRDAERTKKCHNIESIKRRPSCSIQDLIGWNE